MTSQSIALRQPRPDTTPAVWAMLKEQATLLYRSELVNKDQVKSVDDALLVVIKGRELGIPPTQALQNIIVIKGKVTCNAELMLALIYRDMGSAAFMWTTPEGQDDKMAACQYRRPGWTEYRRYTFTMEDAARAGLGKRSTYKPNDPSMWEKFPASMLRARVVTNVARAAFPDVIAGMATYEEMGGEVTVNEAGEVVPTGQVIDVTPTDQPPATVPDAKARLLGRLADNDRPAPIKWEEWVTFSQELRVPVPPSPKEVSVDWLLALDAALVRLLEVERARKIVQEYDAALAPALSAPTPMNAVDCDRGADEGDAVLDGEVVDDDDDDREHEGEEYGTPDPTALDRQGEQAMIYDELIDGRPQSAAWVKRMKADMDRSLGAGELRANDYATLVAKLERHGVKVAS